MLLLKYIQQLKHLLVINNKITNMKKDPERLVLVAFRENSCCFFNNLIP